MAALIFPGQARAEGWKDLKSEHFIVHYAQGTTDAGAQKVLRWAEKYYRDIGDLIGYSRYSNFWTWEQRVKIFIFPDQRTFVQKTGQPLWSTGYAKRDQSLFKSRSIVTYVQEREFAEGILPHEISHMIMRDFLGAGVGVPVWFEEGFAQIKEAGKIKISNKIMKSLVRKGQFIPMRTLDSIDIRREADPQKVTVFYAQSVSVINFMIRKYGKNKFKFFCHELKEGSSFEGALKKTYRDSIGSWSELEKRWKDSLK